MRAGVTAFSPQPVMTTGPTWVYKFAIYTLSVGFNMFEAAPLNMCAIPQELDQEVAVMCYRRQPNRSLGDHSNAAGSCPITSHQYQCDAGPRYQGANVHADIAAKVKSRRHAK